MNLHRNQKGSAAHVVLVTVLVVAILGALGFIFWQNFINKPASSNESTQQSQQTPTDTSTASPIINLEEWRVNASYDASVLGTLTYTLKGANEVTFSSSKVNENILPCAGLSQDSWGIKRANAGETDMLGNAVEDSWTKVGDKYYLRFYPQGGCEEKSTQVSAVDAAYKGLFESLRVAN